MVVATLAEEAVRRPAPVEVVVARVPLHLVDTGTAPQPVGAAGAFYGDRARRACERDRRPEEDRHDNRCQKKPLCHVSY